MSEWVEYKIEQLMDVQNGYAFKSGEYINEGLNTFEVLKMGHIEKGGGLRKNPKKDFVPKTESLKRWVLNKDDIVMTMTDMKDNVVILGVPAMIDRSNHYVLNQRVARLTVKKRELADIGFVYNYLKWEDFLFDLQSKASSGVQVNLSTTAIKESIVKVPPLPEQKAIAAVLSSLDDKIDLLHRQNQTLEAMAATLFRQWFVEEAQDDWEDTSLGSHTVAYRGLSYKGSGLADIGNGLPMHNLNSVFEGGGYKESGIKYYSGEYKERHLVKPGDIIVANTEQGHGFRLIGFPAIVSTSFGDSGLFSQHIYRLVPRQDSYLTPEYIYYLLMTPVVREQITSATNGSTVNMLAIDGLQRPEFKLPPRERIVDFSAVVSAWWRKKEVNLNQIRTLEKLRDTLLPKLMSGEVRVAI